MGRKPIQVYLGYIVWETDGKCLKSFSFTVLNSGLAANRIISLAIDTSDPAQLIYGSALHAD